MNERMNEWMDDETKLSESWRPVGQHQTYPHKHNRSLRKRGERKKSRNTI